MMIKIDDLRAENQQVLDTSEVLEALIDRDELLSNPVFCDLLNKFAERVKIHLSHEDCALHSGLLTHQDKKIRDTASHFLSNTRELKKIFTGYTKQWCKPSPNQAQHEKFVKETRDIFRIIRERIRMENDELFPVLQQFENN